MTDETRLNLIIPQDLSEDLNTHIPWGSKSTIIRNLLYALLSEIRKTNGSILGDIMTGNIIIQKTPVDSE